MKYDPIELVKLNITEAQIQRQRDLCLEALTVTQTQFALIPMDPFWLPFVIDMFEGYEITIKPSIGHYVKIEINLNP